MLNIESLKFEKLDLEGLETLVKWAELEGWNPGPHDAKVFWKTDPDGFYGYFHRGQLIGGGSIVSYNNDFGFMGFFIMLPEFRSQGIGRKLWYQRRDALISRLNNSAPIGMDGVVDMQDFYKKGGFEIAFRDERHERLGTAFKLSEHISRITLKDFDEILKYDTQCFGFSRPQFLKPWLEVAKTNSFKYKVNNHLMGFAVLRKVAKGYKIGPLFAENKRVAEELYKSCLDSAKEESVFIDIPVFNKNAVSLASQFQTTISFECARMYYGKPPKNDIHRTFGITTFELG